MNKVPFRIFRGNTQKRPSKNTPSKNTQADLKEVCECAKVVKSVTFKEAIGTSKVLMPLRNFTDFRTLHDFPPDP